MPPRASFSSSFYFYPRPPRGGRRAARDRLRPVFRISIHALREEGDHKCRLRDVLVSISIHALREEGDGLSLLTLVCRFRFLSTPSARRATQHKLPKGNERHISIHALREEGDGLILHGADVVQSISIHALREEGDNVDF